MKVRRVDFSPDEFLQGIKTLSSNEVVGVYWIVCALIYSKGAPIDDDVRWIAGFLGYHGNKWLRFRRELLAKGKLLKTTFDGRPALTNERAELELNAARRRSILGVEKAGKRWGHKPGEKGFPSETPSKRQTSRTAFARNQSVSRTNGNGIHQPSKNLTVTSSESDPARARRRDEASSRTRDGKRRKP